MDKLSQRLKQAMISNLLNVKQDKLDIHYMTSSQGSFTRRELALEIENETEIGIRKLESVVELTIDLFERGKEKLDE